MNAEQSVVIIILNYNKKNDILECLESVIKQDYKQFQVFVVDNASTDNSVEAINNKYPSVQIYKSEKNLGPGRGRNTGWRFAKTKYAFEYLLFLDDDVILENNFISKLVDVFISKPKVGILCGKAFTNSHLSTIMSAGIKVNMFTGSIYDIGSGKKDNGQFNHSCYVDACGGFAMMVRKEVFSKIGGFDKNFIPYGWEDIDLCLNAKKLGYYTYYLSEATLIHKGTKIGREPNPFYEKNKIKNYVYLIKKNTSTLQKITCSLCLPFRAFLLSVKLIFNGNGKIVLEHFKGFLIGLKNIYKYDKKNF